jgi:hypothetical protein
VVVSARDVDARIVHAGRPVEDARDLPAGVASAVAGDLLHGFDEFMVVDPAIVRAGYSAQFNAAIVSLQRLDLLGPVRGQSVLQIDRRQRRWKLAQISRGRANLTRQLAEAPVGRRDRRIGAGQDQRQALGIVAVCLDMDERALDHASAAAVRTPAHRTRQVAKR